MYVEEIKHLAMQLVRLPSTEGRVDLFEQMASMFMQLLSSCAHFERFECDGLPSYLWSNTPECREFDLLLTGHLDVVPASTAKAFSPHIHGMHLYGRGSADMKGSCAMMGYAFREILALEKWEQRIGLLLTCDEETGGERGARFFCEDVGVRSRVTFLPDGGGWGKLCILQKGAIHLTLHTRGKSAHGARPWLGVSALDLLLDDIARLKQTLLSEGKQSEWGTTLNVGKLHAGASTNSVPDDATAWIDIRFGDTETLDSLRQKIVDLQLHGSTKELIHSELLTVDPAHHYFRLFMEKLSKLGVETGTVQEHGGSDACYYGKVSEIVLMTLPRCSAFHVDDEWVDFESLGQLCGVLVDFADALPVR